MPLIRRMALDSMVLVNLAVLLGIFTGRAFPDGERGGGVERANK